MHAHVERSRVRLYALFNLFVKFSFTFCTCLRVCVHSIRAKIYEPLGRRNQQLAPCVYCMPHTSYRMRLAYYVATATYLSCVVLYIARQQHFKKKPKNRPSANNSPSRPPRCCPDTVPCNRLLFSFLDHTTSVQW